MPNFANPDVTRAAEKETQNRIIGHLPFLPPRVFVKCPSIRKMDGRGGGDRKQQRQHFQDLRGTTRNAKLLKRNDEACKGILIAPSKLPQNSLVFFADVEIPKEWDPHPLPLIGSRLRAQILRRGWQADIWYL